MPAMTIANVALIALFLWLGLSELRAVSDGDPPRFRSPAAILPLLASHTLALGVNLPLRRIRVAMVALCRSFKINELRHE